MPVLPTGTVTFLFTDIEGATTLLQRLGDRRYAEVLAEHQRLLRDAFAKGNGQEIDTQGDAFLVAFSRARDAVATAVVAQQALMKHTWPDGAPLRVRMGLHTGEPLSDGTGYVGIDVHRAARIAAAGHGGQILLSDAVSGLAARDLPPGVSLRDLGTHRLKDLREPEHLLQVVHPDLPADFPPPKSLDVLPNNLPVQLTSFIGREREKAEIRKLLSTTRFVTLTGAGGAGKTRLALQVAAEALGEFRDGVWLVELATLNDPSLVPKAVASALDVPEQPGRALTETLKDALRLKSVLVILDNCEHLVAACARLTDTLLRACPNLRILVTGREALGVTGETTWQVPSLSVPDPEHLPPLDRLDEYEAIRLFIDRAVASASQFAVTGNNAPAVAQVCIRLDGIPLAIELAAARVKVLAVEQIALRLDDRFRLLTGGSRTALPRQQTLRGAMDWSFDLLAEAERVLLRRLSVFAGGWSLEAAEAVCSGNGVDASGILDLLTQLVDKSLVVVETRGGEARYRLLETVRQYGLDRLLEAGETADVRKRHRNWYLDFAEGADPKLRRHEQDVWLDRLETEHDNLRAALAWSKTDKDGAEAWLRLAGALGYFWQIHGHWSEGRRWFAEALTQDDEAQPFTLLRVLRGAGALAYMQGDYKKFGDLYEQALSLSQRLGDQHGITRGIMASGLLALELGDYRRATVLLEESVVRARELGDKWLVGLTLQQLSDTVREQGDYERAARLGMESLSLCREVGDKYRTAVGLRAMGTVSLRQRDYSQATAFYAESLKLCQGMSNRWVSFQCLEGLGCIASARENDQQAAILFGAAEALRDPLRFSRRDADQQAVLDQYVESVRTSLGDAAFSAAWAEGRAMTLEQAIECALAASDEY